MTEAEKFKNPENEVVLTTQVDFDYISAKNALSMNTLKRRSTEEDDARNLQIGLITSILDEESKREFISDINRTNENSPISLLDTIPKQLKFNLKAQEHTLLAYNDYLEKQGIDESQRVKDFDQLAKEFPMFVNMFAMNSTKIHNAKVIHGWGGSRNISGMKNKEIGKSIESDGEVPVVFDSSPTLGWDGIKLNRKGEAINNYYKEIHGKSSKQSEKASYANDVQGNIHINRIKKEGNKELGEQDELEYFYHKPVAGTVIGDNFSALLERDTGYKYQKGNLTVIGHSTGCRVAETLYALLDKENEEEFATNILLLSPAYNTKNAKNGMQGALSLLLSTGKWFSNQASQTQLENAVGAILQSSVKATAHLTSENIKDIQKATQQIRTDETAKTIGGDPEQAKNQISVWVSTREPLTYFDVPEDFEDSPFKKKTRITSYEYDFLLQNFYALHKANPKDKTYKDKISKLVELKEAVYLQKNENGKNVFEQADSKLNKLFNQFMLPNKSSYKDDIDYELLMLNRMFKDRGKSNTEMVKFLADYRLAFDEKRITTQDILTPKNNREIVNFVMQLRGEHGIDPVEFTEMLCARALNPKIKLNNLLGNSKENSDHINVFHAHGEKLVDYMRALQTMVPHPDEISSLIQNLTRNNDFPSGISTEDINTAAAKYKKEKTARALGSKDLDKIILDRQKYSERLVQNYNISFGQLIGLLFIQIKSKNIFNPNFDDPKKSDVINRVSITPTDFVNFFALENADHYDTLSKVSSLFKNYKLENFAN